MAAWRTRLGPRSGPGAKPTSTTRARNGSAAEARRLPHNLLYSFFVCVCMCAPCARVCGPVYMSACVCAYVCVYVRARMCTHVCVCLSGYVCACVCIIAISALGPGDSDRCAPFGGPGAPWMEAGRLRKRRVPKGYKMHLGFRPTVLRTFFSFLSVFLTASSLFVGGAKRGNTQRGAALKAP